MTTLLSAPLRQVPAGDTIEYLQAVPADYLGWEGSARLTGPSTMDATSCDADGSDFRVKFAGQGAEGTADLAPGQYTLTVFATQGDDRKTIAQHTLTILPDAARVDDGRSYAAQILDTIERAIKARLEGNTDGGVESYAVDGLNIMKVPMAELERMRARYANEVAHQQNGGRFGSVQMVFTKSGDVQDMRARYPGVS